jgi:hypothetical protein
MYAITTPGAIRRERASRGLCVVDAPPPSAHSTVKAPAVHPKRDLKRPHTADCKKEPAFSQTAISALIIFLKKQEFLSKDISVITR